MIDLHDVRKVYHLRGGNDVVALDDVTLHVDAGSIHGIVGQSGAGKSTLIRCLTALERPTSGEIVVNDVDMTQLRGAKLRQARRNFGMAFQAANLLDASTAAENIAYPLQISRTTAISCVMITIVTPSESRRSRSRSRIWPVES